MNLSCCENKSYSEKVPEKIAPKSNDFMERSNDVVLMKMMRVLKTTWHKGGQKNPLFPERIVV